MNARRKVIFNVPSFTFCMQYRHTVMPIAPTIIAELLIVADTTRVPNRQ